MKEILASIAILAGLAFVWFVVLPPIGSFLSDVGRNIHDEITMSPEEEAEWRKRQKEWETSLNNPVYACTSQGGVPIISAWTGAMKDCKFKEEK